MERMLASTGNAIKEVYKAITRYFHHQLLEGYWPAPASNPSARVSINQVRSRGGGRQFQPIMQCLSLQPFPGLPTYLTVKDGAKLRMARTESSTSEDVAASPITSRRPKARGPTDVELGGEAAR